MVEQFGKPSLHWCEGYWATRNVVNVNHVHREHSFPDPGALLIPEGNGGSNPGLESAGEEIVEDFNIMNDRGWV